MKIEPYPRLMRGGGYRPGIKCDQDGVALYIELSPITMINADHARSAANVMAYAPGVEVWVERQFERERKAQEVPRGQFASQALAEILARPNPLQDILSHATTTHGIELDAEEVGDAAALIRQLAHEVDDLRAFAELAVKKAREISQDKRFG